MYGWTASVCITCLLNVLYYDDDSSMAVAMSLSSAYTSCIDSTTRPLTSVSGLSKAQHIYIGTSWQHTFTTRRLATVPVGRSGHIHRGLEAQVSPGTLPPSFIFRHAHDFTWSSIPSQQANHYHRMPVQRTFNAALYSRSISSPYATHRCLLFTLGGTGASRRTRLPALSASARPASAFKNHAT